MAVTPGWLNLSLKRPTQQRTNGALKAPFFLPFRAQEGAPEQLRTAQKGWCPGRRVPKREDEGINAYSNL